MIFKKKKNTELVSNPIPHSRLVDDQAETSIEMDVEMNVTSGSHDPMSQQCMMGSKTHKQPDYVQQSTFCWGLKSCIQGCVIGVIGMLYFFVVLPAGVLLVFHGINKRRSLTLHLGISILVLPTFLLSATILLWRFCHLKLKDIRSERSAKKQTLAFENPLSRHRSGRECGNSKYDAIHYGSRSEDVWSSAC